MIFYINFIQTEISTKKGHYIKYQKISIKKIIDYFSSNHQYIDNREIRMQNDKKIMVLPSLINEKEIITGNIKSFFIMHNKRLSRLTNIKFTADNSLCTIM